jgi:hypothetical protein
LDGVSFGEGAVATLGAPESGDVSTESSVQEPQVSDGCPKTTPKKKWAPSTTTTTPPTQSTR